MTKTESLKKKENLWR
jgi:dynein light intermediate chain 1, cytosolic